MPNPRLIPEPGDGGEISLRCNRCGSLDLVFWTERDVFECARCGAAEDEPEAVSHFPFFNPDFQEIFA